MVIKGSKPHKPTSTKENKWVITIYLLDANNEKIESAHLNKDGTGDRAKAGGKWKGEGKGKKGQ